jgi:peptide chain release factor 1
MFDKLETVAHRYAEIESRLADVEIIKDPNLFKKLSLEYAELRDIVSEYQNYKRLVSEITNTKDLLYQAEGEMVDLAKQELRSLELEYAQSIEKIRLYLLPKDPLDEKNIILEVRAGAGGDEAALFAGQLFRLYQRYAENIGWSVEVLSVSTTGLGGVKEIVAQIQGDSVYSRLKWEAGVHRVQRVPDTEAQGRVHTSTVTVAILPEAEEVDITVAPSDLRIDVFRSSGAGGQSVNTTDSAVRITHLPSGLVVVCQDERSQIKNKDRALKILRSRLLDMERQRAADSHAAARKSMVGTGDRSERIRTYNFPQGRLTDHRIGLTVYQLPEVMEGKIDEIVNALITHYQALALKEQE